MPTGKSSSKKAAFLPTPRVNKLKGKRIKPNKVVETHDRRPEVKMDHKTFAVPPKASSTTCRTVAKIILEHSYWYASAIIDKDFARAQREIEEIARYSMMYRTFAGNPLAKWTPPPEKVKVEYRKERNADDDSEE